MFYEIKEERSSGAIEQTLINLDDISRVSDYWHVEKSDYIKKEYWAFKISFKYSDTAELRYYSERSCRLALASLREAIHQTIGIFDFAALAKTEDSESNSEPLDDNWTDKYLKGTIEVA